MKPIKRMMKMAGMALVIGLLSSTYGVACTLSVWTNKSSIPRDMNSTATVIAQLCDGSNGMAGKTITFSVAPSTEATLSSTTAVTDSEGQATVTVKSKTIGAVNVPIVITASAAEASNSPQSCSMTLNGIVISLSLERSKLWIASNTSPNTSVLTVTVKDTADQKVQGTVTYTCDLNGQVTPASVTMSGTTFTNAQGVLGVGSTTGASTKDVPNYVYATFGNGTDGYVQCQSEIKFAAQTTWSADHTVFIKERQASASMTVHDQWDAGFPAAITEASWLITPATTAVNHPGVTDANGYIYDLNGAPATIDGYGTGIIKTTKPNSGTPPQVVIAGTSFQVKFVKSLSQKIFDSIFGTITGNWAQNGGEYTFTPKGDVSVGLANLLKAFAIP